MQRWSGYVALPADPGGCWMWRGTKVRRKGYGRFWVLTEDEREWPPSRLNEAYEKLCVKKDRRIAELEAEIVLKDRVIEDTAVEQEGRLRRVKELEAANAKLQEDKAFPRVTN